MCWEDGGTLIYNDLITRMTPVIKFEGLEPVTIESNPECANDCMISVILYLYKSVWDSRFLKH